MSSYLFIPESDWQEFAESLAGSPVICKDGVAMFDSLRVQRESNAAALFNLTMHMCKMVGAMNVWNDFVKDGLDRFITQEKLKNNQDEEKHDSPANDWKNK